MTAAEPATRIKTRYVVLKARKGAETSPGAGNGVRDAWEEVKTLEATNSTDAIKQAAGNKEGSYIAVPARSFQPVKVTVTQQTIVRLD